MNVATFRIVLKALQERPEPGWLGKWQVSFDESWGGSRGEEKAQHLRGDGGERIGQRREGRAPPISFTFQMWCGQILWQITRSQELHCSRDHLLSKGGFQDVKCCDVCQDERGGHVAPFAQDTPCSHLSSQNPAPEVPPSLLQVSWDWKNKRCNHPIYKQWKRPTAWCCIMNATSFTISEKIFNISSVFVVALLQRRLKVPRI